MLDLFRGYDSGAVNYLFNPMESYILLNKVAIFLELCSQKHELETARQALLRKIELRIHAENEKIHSLQNSN